jgi:hypothetical protein
LATLDDLYNSVQQQPKPKNLDQLYQQTTAPKTLDELYGVATGQAQSEEKGFITTALDYLDKPASAVAGVVQYATGNSNDSSVIDAAKRGWETNADYTEVLKNAGVDPETWQGKVLNIGGKILLDPTWIVTPAKVVGTAAKGAKAVGLTDEVAKAGRLITESSAGRKVADIAEQVGNKEIGGLTVKRWLSETSPIQKELDDLERANINSAETIREGSQKIEELKKIDPELGTYVTRAQEGKNAEMGAAEMYDNLAAGESRIGKDAISNETKSQVYAEIAQKYSPEVSSKVKETVDFINDINTNGSRGLLDRGLISQETFDKFSDRYLRREYSKYVSPEEHLNMLRETGQLKEAAAFEKSMDGIARRMGGKYGLDLKAISQRKDLPPEIQDKLGRIMDATHPFAKGGKITADLITRYDFLESVMKNHASDTAQLGYKLIEGKKFGPLDGKYLPREIANEVNRIVPQMTDPAKWWQKAVGWWKLGKTVLSPATFMRNNFSNLALLNIAGVPTYDIPQFMFKAGLELREPGKYTALANKAGTFLHNTLTETELRKFLDKGTSGGKLEAIANAAKTGVGKAADIYQGSEKLGKMAAFMWAIEKKKMVPEAAAKFADEALFNYSKVPPIIDMLRKTGIVPFATFPYKATGATAKALWENPARVAGYYKPVRELQSPDERTVLPDYLNPETLLPIGKGTRTVNGNEQHVNNYLDLQNILPFQSTENLGLSPAFTVASALYQNKNPLTNKEIARKGMTTGEKAAAYADYVGKQLLPATPIIPGTYGYDKLVNQGMLGQPDYRGRQYGLGEAVAHTVLGIKNTPINTIEAGRSRLRDLEKEMQAIRYEIRNVQQDARLNNVDKQKRIAEYKRGLEKASKEMRTVGVAMQRLRKEGR